MRFPPSTCAIVLVNHKELRPLVLPQFATTRSRAKDSVFCDIMLVPARTDDSRWSLSVAPVLASKRVVDYFATEKPEMPAVVSETVAVAGRLRPPLLTSSLRAPQHWSIKLSSTACTGC